MVALECFHLSSYDGHDAPHGGLCLERYSVEVRLKPRPVSSRTFRCVELPATASPLHPTAPDLSEVVCRLRPLPLLGDGRHSYVHRDCSGGRLEQSPAQSATGSVALGIANFGRERYRNLGRAKRATPLSTKASKSSTAPLANSRNLRSVRAMPHRQQKRCRAAFLPPLVS